MEASLYGGIRDHPEPHHEKLSGKKNLKAILTSLLLVLPAEVASAYTLIFFFLLIMGYIFLLCSKSGDFSHTLDSRY